MAKIFSGGAIQNIYQVKDSLLGGVQKLLYWWLSFFSLPLRDICFFLASNFNTKRTAFSLLAFLYESYSWIGVLVSVWYNLDFESLTFSTFCCRMPSCFTSGNSLPTAVINSFYSLINWWFNQILYRPYWVTSSNRELNVQRNNPTNNAPCETLFSSVTF